MLKRTQTSWGALALALTLYSSVPMAAEAPVDLGGAACFAVLSATTVTSTGPVGTTVNGKLGVWPGTAVTGFPPATMNGTMEVGNPVAQAAQADLTTAYNDAAGRAGPPIAIAGNLGGPTPLTPGLYKSTSSIEISSGDLTLDGQNNPDAVFIFQIASTLTTTVGRQIFLINGAQASNIFWQVGSSATLGIGSHFEGNVMAFASVTVNIGATINGRAMALNGAVTLDVTTITSPYEGRSVGDFDQSCCTGIADFLYLLDNYNTISPLGLPTLGLNDFLSLLDNWLIGPAC